MSAGFKTIQELKTKIKSLETAAKTKEPVETELMNKTSRYKQERNEAEKQYIALKEDFLNVKKEAKKEKAARLSLESKNKVLKKEVENNKKVYEEEVKDLNSVIKRVRAEREGLTKALETANKSPELAI